MFPATYRASAEEAIVTIVPHSIGALAAPVQGLEDMEACTLTLVQAFFENYFGRTDVRNVQCGESEVHAAERVVPHVEYHLIPSRTPCAGTSVCRCVAQ